jgi:hypothetical protein
MDLRRNLKADNAELLLLDRHKLDQNQIELLLKSNNILMLSILLREGHIDPG